jgi:hypothetical protein
VTSAQLTCSWWLSTSGAGRSDENHLTKDFTVFQTNRLSQQLPTTVLYWLANSRRFVYREVLSVIRIVYTSTPVITISTSVSASANHRRVYVWRYPDDEYLEDCCGATVIPGFEKVKVWGAMRHGKLSKLIILPESKGQGKINAKEYCDVIMDGEFFDCWQEGSEEL